MKKCNILLIILLNVVYLFAQTNSNWIQSNTSNISDEKIRKMISVDSTTLFGIQLQEIIRSTDSGNNWSTVYIDTTINFFSHIFLEGDSLYVYTADSINRFWLVSHKDSLSFRRKVSRVTGLSGFYSIELYNDSIWQIDGSDLFVWKGSSPKRRVLNNVKSFNVNGHNISAAGEYAGSGQPSYLYTSSNYGQNWDTVSVPYHFLQANTIQTYYSGTDTLYVIGRVFPGYDFYSTDKGQNWTDLDLIGNGSRKPWITYHFSPSGYIAGNFQGVFLLSRDKGGNFSHDTVISYPLPTMSEYRTHLHVDGSAFLYGGSATHGEIWKNSNPLAVGLSEKKIENIDFEVYPNPTKDYLSIEVSSDKMIERLEVYSISGQLIQSILIQKKSEKIQLNDLSSGTYMIHLITQSGRISKKVIVE
jgi:photosystem II stability/assembly factor-like uncharacterized protein